MRVVVLALVQLRQTIFLLFLLFFLSIHLLSQLQSCFSPSYSILAPSIMLRLAHFPIRVLITSSSLQASPPFLNLHPLPASQASECSSETKFSNVFLFCKNHTSNSSKQTIKSGLNKINFEEPNRKKKCFSDEEISTGPTFSQQL